MMTVMHQASHLCVNIQGFKILILNGSFQIDKSLIFSTDIFLNNESGYHKALQWDDHLFILHWLVNVYIAALPATSH